MLVSQKLYPLMNFPDVYPFASQSASAHLCLLSFVNSQTYPIPGVRRHAGDVASFPVPSTIAKPSTKGTTMYHNIHISIYVLDTGHGDSKNDPLPLGPEREHSMVQQGSPSASLQQHSFMSCGTLHLHVSPIVGRA